RARGTARGGEESGRDHGAEYPQEQGNHPAAEWVVADAVGRIEVPQPLAIGPHHRPAMQEIGEARMRAADESPAEAEDEQAGDRIAGEEMNDRLHAAARADQKQIASDQQDQRPVEDAGGQIPDGDVVMRFGLHGNPSLGEGGSAYEGSG